MSHNENTVEGFLEKTAPGRERSISHLARQKQNSYGSTFSILNVGSIELHCGKCDGLRQFEAGNSIHLNKNSETEIFVTFVCRNCKVGFKKYALYIVLASDGVSGKIVKYGEDPAFVGATATRLLELLAEERQYFLNGRRCEEQGLGIGAYAYYRRVVESNRNKLYDEIIEVCKKQHSDAELVLELQAAKEIQQFSESVATIKHGLPYSLMIDGENPLTLLHGALSKGVHELADEECLERARAVRTVLNEMLERIAALLKDDQELLSAVGKLRALRSRGAG